MAVLAIYNPACGDRSSKSFFDEHVLPLLQTNGKTVDKLVATEHPGHAGQVLVDFLEANEDGTLNECITTLSSAQLKRQPTRITFILVPCGTANALYSSLFPPSDKTVDTAYRLQSLQSFISGSTTTPINLAITTLSSPPAARKRPEARISSVVVSTCLHAMILRDSEALRAEMPGLERFKVAAERNGEKWYKSWVKLLPAVATEVVQIYDPATKTFVDHPESDDDDVIVELDGPFAYFLATVNVDRLEPAFMISPLVSRIPPSEATCDLVILYPPDTPETRAAFVSVLWKVLGAAYQNGSHVDLRYDAKGEVTSDGDGPPVVEYIRCGGWEWIPANDLDAHGRAVCLAAAPNDTAGFVVHK
ncbi:ATP-NAD kinase-like domain-containing protein [Mycena rebaudengoi]|nr:ATP-NAD kinase-like domain-containing protein [Mycena rebaudengoi]